MKIKLLVILLFLSLPGFAIDAVISGNEVVRSGSIFTYTVEYTNWDQDAEDNSNVSWNVSRGVILSSDKHSVTIQWENWEGEADGYGYISVSESLNGQSGFFEVLVDNYPLGANSFCDGILGPAAVYVDFGSGSNPGPALAAGHTTYSYSAFCALTPDHYTIVTNTSFCRSLWWPVPEDHTPNDVNGYMLMVDGATTTKDVYRTSVSGLIAGTKYEFSAWCGNLYTIGSTTAPELSFEIYDQSGNRLGTSGKIQLPANSQQFQWQKIGFIFELPAGTTSVQIVILNSQRSSGGNDFVIDDISFAPCYPPIIASFSSTERKNKEYVCSNGSINLYSYWPLAIQFSNPVYQWQRSADDGATWGNILGANGLTSSYTETNPGVYKYRMYVSEATNPSLSLVSNELIYFVQTMVVDAKTYQLYGCDGSVSAQLESGAHLEYSDPSIIKTYTYNWTPSSYLNNANISSPVFSKSVTTPSGNPPAAIPPTSYSYNLSVTNTNYGCSGSSTQTVLVYTPRKVYVPNAFSPNNDGVNDFFNAINLQDYPGAQFWVYNRWGQTVYYSAGPTYSWNGYFNGNPQATGNYVWQVNIGGCSEANVVTPSGNKKSGNVILVR